jgi:oligo-alginate lyase
MKVRYFEYKDSTMLQKVITTFLGFLLLSSTLIAKEHPSLFTSVKESQEIKLALGKYPLLDKSFKQAITQIDIAVQSEIVVPQPGEAGGYEHERHKQNYRDMQLAGLIFQITEEEKYAQFVKSMLLEYSEMYPKLGPHPKAHNQAPGKLFHQMLNEVVWLVHVSQAYDCIYNWLSEKDRKTFENNIFQPMIEWFTVRNGKELDRIHNHGTWSVAAIGMIGYVLGDQNLIDIALYGTKKDGNGGFLKQLELLFSPDGYYMEGPYYIRYALRPFFYFAEAIERNQPDLKIYEYRDQILKKAYYSAVQTCFPNGTFPPINDASKTMNVQAQGVLIANDLAYYRYGTDPNLLGVAKIQDLVALNAAGLKVAEDFAKSAKIPEMNWRSVEFSDGYNGKQGGLGILRTGTEKKQSMLLMKYGVHGAGHGHFDKLHFIFFDQGREVIPDYGFGRWVNIEPKFGGRYLPENKSYAMSTIAHNTVVVDQTTQNKKKRKEADKVWSEKHFFDDSNPNVQVMSARANKHYSGVKMQRTMFLVKSGKLDNPIVIDIYRLASKNQHQYDYPIHFNGQPILVDFPYESNKNMQKPLGEDFGYQHIWKEASGKTDKTIKFTWLDENRYYSLISSPFPETELIFGRIGANDPSFNLRSEPMIIQRRSGENMIFASVIEPHGYFNEAGEKSVNARGFIENVKVIGHNEKATIIEVTGKNDLFWRFIVNNGFASNTKKHEVIFDDAKYNWIGNYLSDLEAN